MSSSVQPESTNPGFVIVLGARQITAVLVVAVSVAGILCSLAYIAGRSGSRAPAPPTPIVAHSAAPKPATPVPLPAAPAPAPEQSAKAVDVSVWMNVPLVRGASYLQLMSVEPGVAEVFAEGLRGEGFDAITSAGVSPAVRRVLVGPLKDKAIVDVRARLEARGLHPFLKKYTESETLVEQPKSDQ